MKKLTYLLLVASLIITSCKKENTTPAAVTEQLPIAVTVLATGSVTSSVHTSSGTVKIVKDAANKTYLVLENFKTDNGPALRGWLSPNNSGTPEQELS